MAAGPRGGELERLPTGPRKRRDGGDPSALRCPNCPDRRDVFRSRHRAKLFCAPCEDARDLRHRVPEIGTV